MIVIFTHRHGFEADYVIDLLRSSKQEVVRINQDEGSGISFYSAFIKNEGISKIIKCDGRAVDLSAASCFWFQQMPPFIGQPSDKKTSWNRGNLLAALGGFYPNEKWFNSPRSVSAASNKIAQLSAARSAGLVFPETLVSNDPWEIREFVSNGEFIVKNLDSPWVTDKEGVRLSYTKKVTPELLQRMNLLSESPLIYQRFVKRKKDYRAVIFSDNLFVASVVSSPGQEEDVRRDVETGHGYAKDSLPGDVIQKIKTMMSAFGLDYCSADVIEDQNGNFYFLELNTCGSWWWLDSLFEGEISLSLARELTRLSRG